MTDLQDVRWLSAKSTARVVVCTADGHVHESIEVIGGNWWDAMSIARERAEVHVQRRTYRWTAEMEGSAATIKCEGRVVLRFIVETRAWRGGTGED